MLLRYSICSILLLLLSFVGCKESIPPATPEYIRLAPEKAAQIADSLQQAIQPKLAQGLEIKLWASDSLLADPVAIDIDNQGNIYATRTHRQKNSEFDIRGHRDWMTASISLQSVEDRRDFLRAEFASERSDSNQWLPDLNGDTLHDWQDLAVQQEEVYRLWDESGDGVADVAQLFVRDFQTEVTDVAGGLMVHDDDVYLAVAPDLWKLQDRNGDGIADKQESLSHGYQTHIGFGGHGMSGITMGPDGRIYWGIGDIGFNVVDKTGKRWEYPNQGAILRCNPDGSDFEVFAAGLRNTHEFVFDDYGNIISEDNDGDHPGESERLVYITQGSDAGWRTNWQFGKYTDPDNNLYKVWMDEELYLPRHENTPAYIIPPIRNYRDGPTGMIYNPGTAVSPKYKNHFFVVSFRGAASRSPIYAFTLKPDGAGFAFEDDEVVMEGGILPTGIRIGPDGAMYIADWIDGWGTKNYGRIWRLDDPEAAQSELRKQTEALVKADFADKGPEELKDLLAFEDKRVRQKAQFALAKRGAKSLALFQQASKDNSKPLAQIHGLWGLWQLARAKVEGAEGSLLEMLDHTNAELRAQAAKILGDIRSSAANPKLLAMLNDTSARVQFFAAEALGRTKADAANAYPPLVNLLAQNNDEDVYLRHAAALAMSRIGDEAALQNLARHDNRSVRMATVLALRRMKSPSLALFLRDEDEKIVLEAARAIHDDFSVPEALADLALLLGETASQNEALLRRIISANLRLGTPANAQLLANYAQNETAPAAMRAEALSVLGVWEKPSVLDRVDGRFRAEVERSPEELAKVVQYTEPVLAEMLSAKDNDIRLAAIEAAGRLRVSSVITPLQKIIRRDREPKARIAALQAVGRMEHPSLKGGMMRALKDRDASVRAFALRMVPDLSFGDKDKVYLLAVGLKSRALADQQAAIRTLGTLPIEATREELEPLMKKMQNGRLDSRLELELIEAIRAGGDKPMLTALAEYEAKKEAEGPMVQYAAALEGGNVGSGRRIFRRHEAAQCMRCHAVGQFGEAEVGPNLGGIANVLSRKQLLESLVDPSARLAPGFGTVMLTLDDGEKINGLLLEDGKTELKLQGQEPEPIRVPKVRIAQRRDAPSAMPPMGKVLSMRELRDLVAFLTTLK